MKAIARLLRVLIFAFVIYLCYLAYWQDFSVPVDATIIIGFVLLVFPTVWFGRKTLDRDPGPERVERITAVVHALLMFFFGCAIVRAIKTAPLWRGWQLPISPAIGLLLVRITGIFTTFTVINLALRALGAPFAISLSRRLATDWLYRWTRNPMVLGTLAFLFSWGLWEQSTLFVLWVVLLLSPAWIAFVKIYEERELELRFGQDYLDYKARTPFLLPGRPKP